MGGTWQSMDMSVEDYDDVLALVVGKVPAVLVRIIEIDGRGALPDDRPRQMVFGGSRHLEVAWSGVGIEST